MVRGGEIVGHRSNFKRRVRSKDEDSDDSDEDYVVSLEGNEESEDDAEYYCPSLDECASEEGFQSFIDDDDDDDEEKEVRKVVRTKGKRISPARRKKTVGRKSRNRKAVSDEDDDYDYDEEEEEVRKVVRSNDKRLSSAGMRKIMDRTSQKRKNISGEEDDDEGYEEEEEEEEPRKIVERKSQKRKGVSDEEGDDDDDEEYYKEEEEMGKIVDRKSQNWKSISGEEDDDEDYEEEEEEEEEEMRKIMDRKSKKQKGVSDEEEEDDDDEDYKEEEEMGRIVDRRSRKRRSISDEEDDDEDYEEEEMRKIVDRKSKKRKGVSDEEDDDEDYKEEEEEMGKIVDKSGKRKSIFGEEEDDEDYQEEEMRKIVDRKSQKRKGVSDDEDYKEGEEEEEMGKLVDRRSQKWKGTSDEDDDEDYKDDEEEEEMRKIVDRKSQKRKSISDDEDYEEEEEEEEEETRKIVDRKLQKRKGASDEEDDNEDFNEEDMRKIVDRKLQKRKGASDEEDDDEDFNEEEMKKIVDRKSQKRNGVSDEEDEDYKEVEEEGEEEEDDDSDFTLDEEDDDVEFILDDEDCLDEEEELTMKKKKNNKNISKQGLRKNGPSNHREKRKKSAVSRKPLRKGGNKKRRLKRKRRIEEEEDDDDCDFIDKDPIVRKKSRKIVGQRKTACVIHSDSDFVSSGSSDHEFTISEEEREQVKEASQMCGSLKTNLRSSSSAKRIEEVEELGQCKKPPARKGKEKVEETKGEVIKPVCGICLSEEDKRRLRGKLNCCSHYFCFTCIMEWSKVESRCPLCKQRFETISKSARSTSVADSRDVVIQVPKRDQVYQPSEEELRSYLDPYENVICSECNQGGDDGLMLLCDICDSSAHTYCVGLGREVPEGNWYCDGCRPVALGSSSSQVQDSLPDQGTMNNLYNRFSPVVNLGESLDSIAVPSPRTSFPPGFVGLSSPRFPVVDMPPVSPVSGMGAQTLTGRRWLHRQIQNLRSFNRMNLMAGMTDGISTANMGIDLINSHIDQSRQTAFTEGFQDNPSSSMQSTDLFSPRLGHLRRQPVQDSTTTTLNTSVNMMLWPQPAGINLNEQFYQCSNGSNIGPDVFGTPFPVRQVQQQQQNFSPKNEDNSYMAKEQLQVMVRSQLKALSNGTDLDNGTFTDIATSSMHTLLAACGLEHRRSEVHIVPPPSNCTHIERVAAGQASLMKGCCLTCFDSFVKDVVKRIMDTRSRQWLSLGL